MAATVDSCDARKSLQSIELHRRKRVVGGYRCFDGDQSDVVHCNFVQKAGFSAVKPAGKLGTYWGEMKIPG